MTSGMNDGGERRPRSSSCASGASERIALPIAISRR